MEVFNFDDVIQLRRDPEKPTLLKKKSELEFPE